MKTMNEEQQAANSREVYEAPKCEIIEMQQEGVLCQSGGFNSRHNGYDEDTFNW